MFLGDNHTWLIRMLKEVNILEGLKHPNIIDYKHAWIEHHIILSSIGPEVPTLFILMEFANGGNLENFILKQLKRDYDKNIKSLITLTDHHQTSYRQLQLPSLLSSGLLVDIVWSLFKDICCGLAFLHKNNMLHRDLKPSNLLLKYKEKYR